MVGPEPAVAAVRLAVRRWLTRHPQSSELTVALSGGADSRALCSATLFETRGRIAVHAVTIDHQLQDGSAEQAEAVRRWAVDAGCASAQVVTVEVGTRGGLEAAARDARYAALGQVRRGDVLLGHTLDDQAESVLLGLGRGSGRRSLQGMAPYDAPWGRPLLEIRRAQTRQYCADLDLPVWDDPHNDDPRFTRVRLRTQALPMLEEILGGGVAEALARTASQLQDDDPRSDIDAILLMLGPGGGDAADRGGSDGPGSAGVPGGADAPDPGGHVGSGGPGSAGVPGGAELDAEALARFAERTRRAVIKRWLDVRLGGPSTSAHVAAVDALVAGYRGQGPVYLPGGSRVIRERGRISHAPADISGRAAPRTRPT